MFETAIALFPLQPFSPEALQVCADLSKSLLKQASRPDLVALGFWLREAQIMDLRNSFLAKQEKNVLLVPRGRAFHIPPANVEVMAIYSWIPSLLVGNANIVRWPTQVTSLLKMLVEEVLPLVANNTRFISYGHEEETTERLSAEADVRVIWGGDETIRAIRKIPLKPRAKELVFASRSSLAVIRASSYLAAGVEERQRLVEGFYNDTFWFDQRACSSPRSIVWMGERADEAREIFYESLQQTIADKQYTAPLALCLEKMTHTYLRAMDEKYVSVISNELSIVHAESLPEEHCGYGLLYDLQLPNLTTLADLISKREQTLTYFGIEPAELRTWAQQLNGRGIDRFVPIGEALQFQIAWDGYDLLEELSFKVVL